MITPDGLVTQGLYINGEWDTDAPQIDILSPLHGHPYGRAHIATTTHLEQAAAAARRALPAWADLPPRWRAEKLHELGRALYAHRQTMTEIIHREVASPIAFCEGPQVTHPIGIYSWYAQAADHVIPEQRPGVTIIRRPVGVVAAITPWNMPQKTIAMKIAPALLAGCTVIVKAAPETPFDALYLAELADQVGFPPGVINVVPALRDTSAYLPRSPFVDKVAFTGSTKVGREIAARCARDIRRYSLELGGKSAAILLPGADLEAWQRQLVEDSLLNNGQICSNQTRLIAHRDIFDEVVLRATSTMSQLKVGDPRRRDVHIGPLITPAAAARYKERIAAAEKRGAVVHWGLTGNGTRPDGWQDGNWVQPALVTNIGNRDQLAAEEVFGPVLVALPADNAAHALKLAEDSTYGLHAGVWGPRQVAETVAGQLRVGQVQINGGTLPLEAPLGGFKRSGWGRELGPEGLSGYLETTAVTGRHP